MNQQETNDMITACMNLIQWEHHTGGEWQFYVGTHTQRVWESLSFNQKLAIAMDAHEILMRALTAVGQEYGR